MTQVVKPQHVYDNNNGSRKYRKSGARGEAIYIFYAKTIFARSRDGSELRNAFDKMQFIARQALTPHPVNYDVYILWRTHTHNHFPKRWVFLRLLGLRLAVFGCLFEQRSL